MQIKYILQRIALLVIVLGLAACGAPAATDAPPLGAAPDATPTTAVPKSSAPVESPAPRELVLAAPRDLAPGEQDPYYTALTLRVWESLVTVDDDWNPQPQLAESWEQSEDGLSWTFKLRRDVVFSDGSPFNADVVLANIERNQRISPRSSPFYSLNAATAYGDLQVVEQVDAYTVRFVHSTPTPAFPAMIATYYSAMFAPASFTAEGDFKGPPIASGPYRVIERVPEQYVVLEPNPRYHGPPPRAERVRIRTIPDPNTRAAALRAGEIHAVLDLGAIQPAAAKELTQTGEFGESSAPIAITHYIFVNGAKAPWSDPRLRQAVSLAVDRQRIVDDLFLGYGIPAGSMLSVVSRQWHDSSITLSYDPDRAAELAREVLGEQRLPALILIPSYQIDRYPYKALGEYVQAQLRPLGIDAEVRILDGPAFNQATEAGEYDLALRIQGLANSEPEFLLRGYLSQEGGTNKSMSLGYRDDEVEAALESLRAERDPARRGELYRFLQQRAARDLPVVPLFYEKGVVVFHKDVQGYELRTSGGVSLETAFLR